MFARPKSLNLEKVPVGEITPAFALVIVNRRVIAPVKENVPKYLRVRLFINRDMDPAKESAELMGRTFARYDTCPAKETVAAKDRVKRLIVLEMVAEDDKAPAQEYGTDLIWLRIDPETDKAPERIEAMALAPLR